MDIKSNFMMLDNEKYYLSGSFEQIILDLFPNAHRQEIQQLLHVLPILRKHGGRVHDDSKIAITGSSVKRLRLGTPPGWETPGKLARTMMTDDKDLSGNDLLRRIGHVGPNDLDLRMDVSNGASFEQIFDEVAAAVDSDTVVCEHKTFGISHLLRLTFGSGWIVDIGMLAYEDFSSNCRTSPILPYSEAFSVIFIDNDDKLFTNDRDPRDAISDEAFLSFDYRTTFPQAFISLLRVRLNSMWWGPLPDLAIQWRLQVSQVSKRHGFWNGKIAQTETTDFESRTEEMNAGILLYLLSDPWRFLQDANMYHFLSYMDLDDLIVPNILGTMDPLEYRKMFNNGSLPIEESGLHLLSSGLGSSPAETLNLLKLNPSRLQFQRT